MAVRVVSILAAMASQGSLKVSKDEILDNLKRIPLNPKYLDHKYNKYTYPIQDANTRTLIKSLKADLAPEGFFFTRRFADWEYYNMDVAIGAAMDLCMNIQDWPRIV